MKIEESSIKEHIIADMINRKYELDVKLAIKLSNIKGCIVFGSVPRSLLAEDFMWNDIDIIIDNKSLFPEVLDVLLPHVPSKSNMVIQTNGPDVVDSKYGITQMNHIYKVSFDSNALAPVQIDVLTPEPGREIFDSLRIAYQKVGDITANFNFINYGNVNGIDSWCFSDARNKKIRRLPHEIPPHRYQKLDRLVESGWELLPDTFSKSELKRINSENRTRNRWIASLPSVSRPFPYDEGDVLPPDFPNSAPEEAYSMTTQASTNPLRLVTDPGYEVPMPAISPYEWRALNTPIAYAVPQPSTRDYDITISVEDDF